ncbi:MULTISPECIES: nitroreductase family protein [unclassified Pseudoalteromonas]|uniref:nitroreductase family protein n=1 Tax=unclassified Pseudoalteromonas TaxID=194690 RepID=UPI001023D850|nr:nitroreductase family protein [Pseudoalteromonas sp. L1]RZF91324.1 nitroreductase family protein [Pseudoalteromonas sp. CO302Y]RZG07057.1 nitroreductase family protein [Pseudoalteromonas sp. CO133X]
MKAYVIKLLKRVIEQLQVALLPLCSKSPILSGLYFTFFSRDFFYEHQAILKARLAYNNQQGMHGKSSALLRRNIHRLEKGLIMQPRRSVFALDYLTETLTAYQLAVTQSNVEQSELQWATDVLSEYFSVVDKQHLTIAKNYAVFQQLSTAYSGLKKPYAYQQKEPHQVSYEQFLALTKFRTSVRWFEQKQVELEKIEKALAAALQAPSACNRQPFEFYSITEQPLLNKLANLPGGTAGFADNIPHLIAVVGDLSYYPFSRDRHVIYIDGSLASMQFMLALETLGLSSCPINWPELITLDKRVAKLLDLPQYKRVVMFIAVGYPANSGMIPYSDKKQAKDILKQL